MATIVIMPKQGQSVESCILFQLHKKKGDTVTKGETLFSYETDKASFDEPAPVDGTVLAVFFGEGDEIPVLSNVMVIGQPGEALPAEATGAAPSQPETAQTAEAQSTAAPAAGNQPTPASAAPEAAFEPIAPNAQAGPASPRAKALALKEGIDLRYVTGTGPDGRIIERDVQTAVAQRGKLSPLAKQVAAATGQTVASSRGTGLNGMFRAADLSAPAATAAATAAASPADEGVIKPLTHMRKLIAKAMHNSLQNSAQLTHHLSADARRIQELRKQVKKAVDNGSPYNITLNDMICLAVIKALKKFPQVNAHFLGDSIKYFSGVNLALAVDTDRGLMVPVVKNAGEMTIQELSNALKQVANDCKKGSINPDLLSPQAAGFTVSNLGNYGVEIFTPVINLPQVAILGVNTIVPRPKDMGNGVYGFVPHIGLSLTYDHRALDGGEATRFVKQIAIEIENLAFDII